MSLFRQSSADKRYRTYGPWITTATVTGCDWAFTDVEVEAGSGDWTAGLVEQDTDDTTRYTFRVLVSGLGLGGTVELTEGSYRIWIRVDQDPEEFVLPVGTLTVY